MTKKDHPENGEEAKGHESPSAATMSAAAKRAQHCCTLSDIARPRTAFQVYKRFFLKFLGRMTQPHHKSDRRRGKGRKHDQQYADDSHTASSAPGSESR